MKAFNYVSTTSVEETVSILSEEGDKARILCGGTDLLVQMREGRRKVDLVVDVKRIPDLNELTYNPTTGLRIGAAVPCIRIYRHPLITKVYSGLIDAVSLIGGIQIQGRASLGGNLCNASPAADSIPALIVYDAVCIIAGPHGQSVIPVESFCTAPGQTVLKRGEFLVALQVPPIKPHFGAHYLRFIPRNEMDIAVVGVGAAVVLDENHSSFLSARIALGAVAPKPLFVPDAGHHLAGKNVSPIVIDEAATIAQAATQCISDVRGTAIQRRHLSRILTRRVLETAVERARV